MSVLVRTALCFYCYNLILCSYCCTTVVYNQFLDSPLGPSATKNFMRPNEAKHTAIELFTNNVIHSYKKIFKQQTTYCVTFR